MKHAAEYRHHTSSQPQRHGTRAAQRTVGIFVTARSCPIYKIVAVENQHRARSPREACRYTLSFLKYFAFGRFVVKARMAISPFLSLLVWPHTAAQHQVILIIIIMFIARQKLVSLATALYMFGANFTLCQRQLWPCRAYESLSLSLCHENYGKYSGHGNTSQCEKSV